MYKKFSVYKLVPFLTLMMELLWFYPILVWLGKWLNWGDVRPHFGLLSYALLGLLPLVISLWSIEKGWTVRRTQLAVIVPAVLLLFVLIRWHFGGGFGISDLSWFNFLNTHLFQMSIATLAGMYVIWRGVAISRQDSLFENIYHKFMIGLGGVVFLLIAWSLSGLPAEGLLSTVGIYAVSFFGVGLLTMSITNLETISRTLAKHQEAVAAFRRRWLSMLGMLIIGIIVLGIVFVSVFWQGSLIHALELMGRWLLTGITYLFYPAAFVASALYYIGKFFISLIAKKEVDKLEAIKLEDFRKIFEENRDKTEGLQLPPELILALKWFLVLLVIGLVIFFLARLLSRYWRSRAEEGVEEESESLWSWEVFKTDLKNFWFFLFPWLRRRKKELPSSVFHDGPSGDVYDIEKVLTVREIYRSFLKRGYLLGIPRQQSETPYEYALRLSKRRGDLAEDVDSLTGAYVYERYGEMNTGAEKISWLNRIWRSLHNRLRNPGPESSP